MDEDFVLKVGFIDDDREFNRRLCEAFAESYKDKVQFYSFDNLKHALSSCESIPLDVILTEEKTFNRAAFVRDFPQSLSHVIRLTDSIVNENSQGETDIPIAYKYRTAQEWMALMLNFANREGGISFGASFSNTVLCLMLGGSGGAGASSAAMAYAFHASGKGIKTLFLSFEPIPSSELVFLSGNVFDMEDVLYAMRSSSYSLEAMIKQAITEEDAHLWMICPGRDISCRLSITGEEILEICECIDHMKLFELIVLDMHFDSADQIILPFINARKTVIVSDGSEISNYKTKETIKALATLSGEGLMDVYRHTYVLMNNYSDCSGRPIDDKFVYVLGGIEHIDGDNSCTYADVVGKISSHRVFSNLDRVLGFQRRQNDV